jgi:membrane-bound serine protease (ClpP class)
LRIEQSWSERLVGFIGSIAPFLMLIGLAALYVEIKAPGFGAPGIIGILCLGVLFLNQHMVGLADHTEMLLLGAGLILLGLELFVIPGFGVAGIAGIAAIAAAMLLGLQDFVVPDPSLPWQKELLVDNSIRVLGSVLSALVVSIAFMRYVLPKLAHAVEGPYLDTTLAKAHANSKSAATTAVGDSGVAMTLLRPAGKMKRGDMVLDVITEGDFIEKGASIVVIAIKGNLIVVGREGANG